ncbi:MAG: hypothetical protein ACOX7J_00225 [Bacillota bacterium]|jgi:hypothetical protein
MLCPKCKVEAVNGRNEKGDWVAKCRNPKCPDYKKVIKVIIPAEETNPQG